MKSDRVTVEWKRRHTNIGVMIPHPFQILLDFLKDKNLLEIVSQFWDPKCTQVNLLDVCTLMTYWWCDESILAARTSWVSHPTFHHSEMIFDKATQRLIIGFRQPDMDGRHWIDQHLHLTLGSLNPDDVLTVVRPTRKRAHIVLANAPAAENYSHPRFVVCVVDPDSAPSGADPA